MVSSTPRPLYPQGKSPRYPLDRRLDGPQSRSVHGVEEKNSHSPRRESNPYHPIVQPIAQSLYRLSYPRSVYTTVLRLKTIHGWSKQLSRMRGAIPPLPQYLFMMWCVVKHRNNFAFYFTLALKYSLHFIIIIWLATRTNCPAAC
jgi:hypothetical protein